jgi:hypothetical protein
MVRAMPAPPRPPVLPAPRRALLCALLACAGTALGADAACAGTALGAGTAAAPSQTRGHAGTLLTSRRLWATIDVCRPGDQPNTIGVRGSMPGDGKPHDRMYMSFHLEYRKAKTGRWARLATGRVVFAYVGSGASPRQGGRSFQLMPVPGQRAFTLRGVIVFEWRRGRRLISSATRVTEAGHMSLAGADPAGYSAATCLIG